MRPTPKPSSTILLLSGRRPTAPKAYRALTPLLNRAAIRRLALALAGAQRAHKFERVSSDFYVRIDTATRNHVLAEVLRAPSIGKTL